jgi:hypothetical protein
MGEWSSAARSAFVPFDDAENGHSSGPSTGQLSASPSASEFLRKKAPGTLRALASFVLNGRTNTMYSFSKALSMFAIISFGSLAYASGCSDVGEAIDCDQMCNELERCFDSNINVRDCAERCEDRVEDNALADKLDACTDCLDRDQSCSEADAECAVCDEVRAALTP